MTALGLGFFANKFYHCHLHELVHAADLIEVVEQVSDGGGLRNVAERYESIALACGVGFLWVRTVKLVHLQQQGTCRAIPERRGLGARDPGI